MVELDDYLFTYVDQHVRYRDVVTFGGSEGSLEDLVTGSIEDFFGNRFAQAWLAETSFK